MPCIVVNTGNAARERNFSRSAAAALGAGTAARAQAREMA
jgi:hypothetical protein